MLRKLLIPAVVAAVFALIALATLGPASQATYADTSIDAEEQSFINLINAWRADPNNNPTNDPSINDSLPPLQLDTSMTNAADWKSQDMGENAYFAHNDQPPPEPDGRTPWQRLCDFGYCYNTWKGENIAAGYTTGADVFQGWKNSPGHNANMLGPNYTTMGLARVYVQGSPYGWYWTNDFGGYTVPGSSPPPAPTSTPTSTPTQAPTASPSPTKTPTKTPTPTPTPEPTNPPVPAMADVDCDDRLTGVDSVLILEFAAGVSVSPISGCPPVGSVGIGAAAGGARYHGDLDCNGRVDALDALAVLLAMTGDLSAVGC